MSRRSQRLHNNLSGWNTAKHARFLATDERDPCAISTCYVSASETTPAGVRFCFRHYENWLRNNPPAGAPVDRISIGELDEEFDDDLYSDEYDDYAEAYPDEDE